MPYLFGFLCVCALGVMPLVGCGETIQCEKNVCPCTEGGIRDAVAKGGGPYTFNCDGPTTVVTGAEIVIDNDVILDGEGNLTLDGNEDHRVLQLSPGVTVTLSGMTISRGHVVTLNGGGITVEAEATLTLNDSTVSGNTATYSGSSLFRGTGGGIYVRGTLTLNDSTVSGNTAVWTGADGFFVRGGRGGGIDNEGGTVVLTNSTVGGNAATHRGGGILNRERGTLTLTNSTVSGNTAEHRGGGIENDSRLMLTNSTVSGNTADDGGGIYNSFDSELTLMNSTVSENIANYDGGGIYNLARTLTLTDSTVSANSADDDGGGIHSSGGTLTLTNSTVSGNSADYGSGLYKANGEMTLTNSTVSGGIHAGSSVPGPLLGMISINTAASLIEGECEVGNGVLTWTSNGYNIESPGDTCGFDQGTDKVDVTEMQLNLGPLQDNGGPTMTHALGDGSAAINKIPQADCLDADGEPLTTDQRGQPRPETDGTTCDVGAFEVQEGSL